MYQTSNHTTLIHISGAQYPDFSNFNLVELANKKAVPVDEVNSLTFLITISKNRCGAVTLIIVVSVKLMLIGMAVALI